MASILRQRLHYTLSNVKCSNVRSYVHTPSVQVQLKKPAPPVMCSRTHRQNPTFTAVLVPADALGAQLLYKVPSTRMVRRNMNTGPCNTRILTYHCHRH